MNPQSQNDLGALTPEQIKSIAKESYIALFPLFYNYGTMYNQAINSKSVGYVGGFGVFRHYGLATPENKDIPTPNNNTPYSWAWVDLRTEPWVLTMPPCDGNRYYVCQWDDMWAYVVDAPGSIIDGQDGGNYLLTTVDYNGPLPEGIKRAIKAESQFMGTLTRTGVNGPEDVLNMEKIQKGYKLQPLSSFLKNEAPKSAPEIDWMPFNPDHKTTIDFFSYVNFMLPYIIPNDADKSMMENAAKIGIGAAKPWSSNTMDKEVVKAIEEGIKEGFEAINKQVADVKSANKLYNTRAVLGEDYVVRSAGIVIGQFGNYSSQATYFAFQFDSDGNPLDASKNNYKLSFPPGQIPEAKYFWSFTMYNLPNRFLVANPINRYSIGSQTQSLKKEADGSITIYFQSESPGANKEGNWLPTPDAPFFSVLRIFGPGKALTDGSYKVPQMKATSKR